MLTELKHQMKVDMLDSNIFSYQLHELHEMHDIVLFWPYVYIRRTPTCSLYGVYSQQLRALWFPAEDVKSITLSY